jgi:hypothetical protein
MRLPLSAFLLGAMLFFMAAQKLEAATYADWKAQKFNSSEQADASISGESACPVRDGLPNLLKYALGLDPHQNQASSLPKASPDSNGYLSIAFPQDSALTDITYVVEYSSDLLNWNRGSGYVKQTSSVALQGTQSLATCESTMPLAHAARAFMRLTILEGNALPANWQLQYFGQTGIDPNADPNGNGISNFNEYLAGTSPTDPNSGVPPLYAVIDLGSNMSPMSLGNTGYVLLKDNSSSQLYRWHNGVTDALLFNNINYNGTLRIDDQGTVPAVISGYPSQGAALLVAYACAGSAITATPLPFQGLGPNDGPSSMWNISAVDYNGTIYGNTYWGVRWNPSNGPSGETYPTAETSISSLAFNSYGQQTNPTKSVFGAKNNHVIGGVTTWDGFFSYNFVDGNQVDFQPVDISTAGIVVGYTAPPPNYSKSYFVYTDATHRETISGAQGLYSINHATVNQFNVFSNTVSPVECPQILGWDSAGNEFLAQKNPDTGLYTSPPLSKLVPSQAGWSNVNGTAINDSSEIIGTATYTLLDNNDTRPPGSHAVLLAPAYEIQVDAFIPQEFVQWPGNQFIPLQSLWYFYAGDKRKTPLDGMTAIGSGTSIFTKPGSYRLRQKVMATVFKELDPDGSQEKEEHNNTSDITPGSDTGLTICYNDTAMVGDPNTSSGHILPTATSDPNYSPTHATPKTATVTVTHPSSRIVQAEFVMEAGDPLALGASTFGPIYYDITVKIDATTTPPTYTLTGNHKNFPAYEVYINQQLVHDYSPIPEGYTPLVLPTEITGPNLTDPSITGGTTQPLTGNINP